MDRTREDIVSNLAVAKEVVRKYEKELEDFELGLCLSQEERLCHGANRPATVGA